MADVVEGTGLDALRNVITCSTVQVHTANVTKIVNILAKRSAVLFNFECQNKLGRMALLAKCNEHNAVTRKLVNNWCMCGVRMGKFRIGKFITAP